MAWTAPSLSVSYGPYFKQDVDDQVKIVSAVRAAIGGGASGGTPLITRELALKVLAPMFGIENVAAVIAKLDEEQQERDARASENVMAEQKSLHEISANADAAGDRSGSKGKQPGPPGR